VRFRVPDAVFSAVQRAVRQTVVAQAPIPPVGQSSYRGADVFEETAPSRWSGGSEPFVPPANQPSRQTELDLPDYQSGRWGQHRNEGSQFTSRSQTVADDDSVAPTINEASVTEQFAQRPRNLPPLRVVGQIAACYIVTEGPAGMYLIDQHAAHERILYEQFMLEQETHHKVAQRTLEAVNVELSPESARLVEGNLESLASIGFEIESFGGNQFMVRAVPSILADRSPAESIAAILEDLESGEEPGASTLEAKIVLRVCKAAAVKAGQTLSFDEMQSLIRQLERCASPLSCPHGRPTMVLMSADQLAREFGRIK
jgi:DNA mismatch repair protein MutL